MMASSASSLLTSAKNLQMKSTTDVVDNRNVISDALVPELTNATIKSQQRVETSTSVAHDLTSTTMTEGHSSTMLLSKIIRTSTVSDPAVAAVLVSTVATTLTPKDISTAESNVPTVQKQNVNIDDISSTFRSDTITTPTLISGFESASQYDDIHSDFESRTVLESVTFSDNDTRESEVRDIFMSIPSNGDIALTTEDSSTLASTDNMLSKSNINMAVPSNHTSEVSSTAPATLTSGTSSLLKSEFETALASNFMTELTSGSEYVTSKIDTTATLQLTTLLTSKVDATSGRNVASAALSQNESSLPNSASTFGIIVHETSSVFPVTTSAVADSTSLGAELATTTLVSPSSTSIPQTIETSRTKPVKLLSSLSTSSSESINSSTMISTEHTSATVIPAKSQSRVFIATSNIRSSLMSSAIQKSTSSLTSSSLSYTLSTKTSGQHVLSSGATTYRMKNDQTSTFEFNGTLNGTAFVDSYPGANVALAVSLSLIFGLTFILVVSALIYCLLRNYCHQFHRCCSKHTGRCKLCSYSCVENRHYHGLQQRLTETPDLISESVHAQITRIARGSSHPDQIALLERSLDDQHSLNELDQLVFEDPDLVSPTSELFVDCRLACSSSAYNCRSPENDNFHGSYDDLRDQNSASGGRTQNSIVGACFSFPDSSMCAHAREPQAEASNCGRWQAATVENPYLKPSCHAHVEPGPNWRPFHPYDPVYVPHHDPIGMQRRLEGTYVTSPRLRMKLRNLYEEVRVNTDTRRLMPVSPPIVPSRGTGNDSISAPVAPIRVSSRPSPVVPNRSVSRGSGMPVAPVRVSSRSSPIVHSRGNSIEKHSSAGTPKPPVRVSSRSSPVPYHRGAALDHARPSSPASVTPRGTRSRSPSTTSNRALLLSSINSPTKGSSRATGESSLLDRSLPKLPVSENSPEPSVTCFSGGQRDSTSSTATIPGHEYSRVDFGCGQPGPAPIVTTAEVEPYETDSDSCRDGAYESIDFPKNPSPS